MSRYIVKVMYLDKPKTSYNLDGGSTSLMSVWAWSLKTKTSYKSKANNTAGLLAVRFLAAFSQPTHIVVGSLQLTHGPLVSLTDFFGSCAQAGCKLTARFSSLSFPLSSTSAFSRLTACYYTCSNLDGGSTSLMSVWAWSFRLIRRPWLVLH